MSDSQDSTNLNGVAIIGIAGRFPGAAGIDDFWRNLCEGVESITFFDDNDLDASVSAELKSNPNYIRARGTIKDVDGFDAGFFRVSPWEATITDPQQRIFLECAWEALEDAGYNPDTYKGLIGVYGGTGFNTYLTNVIHYNRDFAEKLGEHQMNLANAPDSLATRVSYKLNLKGPSVSLYTGCSLSLVAVCLAFDSLMNYQCDMALAGGSFVNCPQNSGYLYEEGEIVSSDGHCRPFDARATGTVFSNGVGIVLLKRLEDALRDRDQIYAVIKGTAMNNDGANKVSFTAPSVDGQAEVIAMAQASADIPPETISYIEAHGTATYLGDTVEIAALREVFGNGNALKKSCAIGSIKANIGHLDAAAGVAGLIKTALMLKHKVLVPSINFIKPNPEIDFEDSPFYVNNKLTAWNASYPRRAAVSSFGVGGTNAHVILEESPVINYSPESRPWQLLLLSARTSTALETTTEKFTEYLKHHRDLNLPDVACTLQNGRKAYDYRRMLVCQDIDDAINTLETGDQKRVLSSVYKAGKKDVVFIFSGQGSQYINMGLELYETEPVFKEEMNRCFEILRSQLKVDLYSVIYPDGLDTEEAARKLTQTSNTQPALFIIEYALAKLWMSWGVHPVAMVGHSIGEYVAACLAGVFSLEDALKLVTARGQLMQELPGGSMLAVFLSEKDVQPWLNNKLSLAVINGTSLCVISGETEAIADLEKRLSEKKVACRHVHTSHAFHSEMMEPILNAFLEQVKQVKLNVPQIPFVSNYTGKWIAPDEATNPDYWVKHLRNTVRYADCLQELLKEPDRVLLEVGPGSTFSTLARQHPDSGEHVILATTRHPKEKTSDVSYLLNALGQLWMAGIEVDWTGFYKDEVRHRLPLPTYPFEHQRYWIDIEKAPAAAPIKLEEVIKTTDIISVPPAEEKDDAAVNVVDNIEQTLASIWQKLLGVKGGNYHDNFFDLGGSSLIGVHLFAEIEKIFGKKLPLAILYKAPTIEKLANYIRLGTSRANWSCLVEIQSGGSKPPLFLIHAAGGNVLIYHDLVRHLGPEQPVYGIQALGLDREQPILTNIEDMAAHYIKEILKVRPGGPYLLAGYCLGGKVALEIAQRLQKRGKEVALLCFMETYNSANEPVATVPNKILYCLQKIGFIWSRLWLSKYKKDYILEKVEFVWNISKLWLRSLSSKNGDRGTGIENDQYLFLLNLQRTNEEASNAYVPKAYPGRIIQFLPENEFNTKKHRAQEFETIAKGGLEVYKIPTFPGGMFMEPFARMLAEKLKVCIEKALKRNQVKRV